MLALLAPGQGAQRPGLLTPWLGARSAHARLRRWSDLTGLDLLRLGTTGTAQEIRQTSVAQPLLTATALLSAPTVLAAGRPGAVCGHSVGELAALALAGVVDDDTAVVLAASRGAAMSAAAAQRATGMAAVLGGRYDDVAAAADQRGLHVATVNAPGQVVVGGPVEALDALADTPPAGMRVRRLEVAGAFHTPAMEAATAPLRRAVDALQPADPGPVVVANADGAPVDRGRELLDRLVGQLTGPVRFDLCLQSLAALGVTAVVELAPAGVLAPLARRALPGVPVLALRFPDDWDSWDRSPGDPGGSREEPPAPVRSALADAPA